MPVEFWFDLASTYSYVAAMRIEDAAREAGAPLEWHPFLLGPIFAAQLGIRDSPFNAHPIRGRYMWRDLERLCEKHGLPWRRPSVFPRSSVLAARVASVGAGEPWGPPFVRAAFRANFAEDRDIADPPVLGAILGSLRQDAAAVLARASSPEVKQRLRDETARAESLGFFGAPDFLVGGELFFGQDRLDDALAWHRRAAPR